jgi:peroxiredoxin
MASATLFCAMPALSQPPAAAKLEALGLDGKTINLLDHAGQPVTVLVFVRTDCPISNRYAPTLQKLAAEYAQKAKFWLVYPDSSESPARIQRYLQEYGYKNVSAVRDPQHTAVKAAQAQITPEAAVFDRTSRLIYHGRIDNWYQSFGHARSAPTTSELNDAIAAAIAGRPAPVSATQAVGCYISDVE